MGLKSLLQSIAPFTLPKALFKDAWKPACMHVGRQNQLGCVATCTIPTRSQVVTATMAGRFGAFRLITRSVQTLQ